MNSSLTFLLLASVCIVPQAQPELRGFYDSTNFAQSAREAYGWACIPNSGQNVVINFYNESILVGSTVANVQREPVVGLICGDPNHGFVWPYPAALKDGATRRITAKAVVNGTEYPVAGGPVEVNIAPEHEARGHFDFVTPEYAWGWACDEREPSESINPAQVSFYNEAGQYLGEQNPLIGREAAVASICGARNRAFQFALPESLQDFSNHTIFAYATNAQGGGKRLLGFARGMFLPQTYSELGIQRAVTPQNIDDVLGAVSAEELSPADGLMRVNTYCYGATIDDVPIQWDPFPYTGFSIPNSSILEPRSRFQRGAFDQPREVVVQAKDYTFGFFIRSNALGYNSACGALAGSGPGFSWLPNSPTPWPSNLQSVKGRELVVRFTATVPWSAGTAYVHPSLYFRDRRNNLRVWWTVQAFDTRQDAVDEFLGNDGSPIVVTSFDRTGTRGRRIAGSFVRGASMAEQHFEYRINGYQFERLLEAAGCGQAANQLSCNPDDYDLTIAFVEVETASVAAEIGATIKDVSVSMTNYGAISN
jgi:hypothetical protein